MALKLDEARKKMQWAGFSEAEIARVANLTTNNQMAQANKLMASTLASKKKPMTTASVNPASVIAWGATINANPNAPMWQQLTASGNVATKSTTTLPQAPVAPAAPTTPTAPLNVDIWNVWAMRAAQTPEEKAWQANQDKFDAMNPAGTKVEDIQRPEWTAWLPIAGTTDGKTPLWVSGEAKTTQEWKVAGTSAEYDAYTKIIKDWLAKGLKFEEARQVANEAFGTNKDQRNYEILANLQQGYAQDPGLFSDFETFRSSYGYDTKPENEKRILESFFKSKGGKIPGMKPTSADTKARQLQGDLNVYAWMQPAEIADAMNQGKITVWSDLYNQLKVTNPQLIANAENLNAINAGTGKKSVPAQEVETNVGANITKWMPPSEVPNFKDMLSKDENVKMYLDQAREKKVQIDQVETSLENLEDDIRKQYEWTGATEGYLQAIIAQKQKPILRQLNELNKSYSRDMSDVQYYSEIVQADFEAKKSDFDNQRKMEQAKEMAMFEQELGLQTQAKEFEQKMEQQAQMASDPVMATQQVIDQYRQMGVFAGRSDAEIIESVQADIAGWMTLGESLTNLNKAYQSKPAYIAATTPQVQQSAPYRPNIEKIGENDYGYFDESGNLVRVEKPTWTQASWKWWIESLWDGKVTFLWGRVKWDYGMDIAGAEGFEVTTPVWWTVEFLSTDGWPINPYYGHFVDIRTPDGEKVRLSHLNEEDLAQLQRGQMINPGDFIARQKNNGTVIASPGRWVVDVTTWDKNGKVRTGAETQAYFSQPTQQKTALSDIGEYMKDTQPRWPWFSNDDVEAFNKRIDKYVSQWDEKWMQTAYRERLMQDKDMKEEVDKTKKFVKAIDMTQKLLGELENAWKSTNAVNSFVEQIARKLWMTTDEARAKAQTQMWFMLADYIRAISGTAASDVEVQRLTQNMASLKNVQWLNQAILETARENAMNWVKTMIETRMYWKEDLAPKVFSDIYTREFDTDQGKFTQEQIEKEVAAAIEKGTDIATIQAWLRKNGIPYSE